MKKFILLCILILLMSSQTYSAKDVEIRYKTQNNLYLFNKFILGYDKLNGIHENLCNYIVKNIGKNLFILEPRGHFKTTNITIGYPIWRLIKNPALKILIIHKTFSKSQAILTEIKGHYETNKNFRRYYGDWIGDQWTQHGISVSKRPMKLKEPSISIGSIDHELTSGHYDIIIIDDIAGLSDMYSEAARNETIRFFKTIDYIGEKAEKIVIGTRWHKFDVYNYILENKIDYLFRIKTAIIGNKKKASYFPQRWPLNKLLQLQKEDPVLFSAQMMNEPLPDISQVFKMDELNFYNDYSEDDGIKYCYVDLALSKKSSADYTAIIVGSKTDESIKIIKAEILRGSPAETENIIVNICKESNITSLGIESNAFQEIYVDRIEERLEAEGLRINVSKVQHSTDKRLRINSIHGAVINDVCFRDDWQKKYPLLIRQLLDFPQGKHDDAPDALEGLLSMYKKDSGEVGVRYL